MRSDNAVQNNVFEKILISFVHGVKGFPDDVKVKIIKCNYIII